MPWTYVAPGLGWQVRGVMGKDKTKQRALAMAGLFRQIVGPMNPNTFPAQETGHAATCPVRLLRLG